MENQNKILIEKYQQENEKSYQFLSRGVEILKTLLSRNFESYIIGSCVRNFYINQLIDLIEIVTYAKVDEIKKIYPSLIIDQRGIGYLKDNNGYFYFSHFEDDVNISKKYEGKHYNKKLVSVLQNKYFTIDSLVITPTFQITDVLGGEDDLKNMLIKPIDKPKSLFNTAPIAILEALELVALYDFDIDKKTLKIMAKSCAHLEDIKDVHFIKRLRKIIKGKYGKKASNLIVDYKLFRFVHIFDLYIKKINRKFDSYTFLEKLSILYLLFASIPDAESIDPKELNELTENLTISQLVASNPITPMMVYNIGADKLTSANKIAMVYKHNYSSQARRINKLKKKAIINNIRELNISNLEIIKLLDGERSIKVKIIINMLLEKVINGEIINHNTILKDETKKLSNEIDEIFNYQEPGILIEYDEDSIKDLKDKYEKELAFLVKVYLSDEKELYNLTALEREEAFDNAKKHAKEFLLETSQYKVLEKRGLI